MGLWKERESFPVVPGQHSSTKHISEHKFYGTSRGKLVRRIVGLRIYSPFLAGLRRQFSKEIVAVISRKE